MTAEYRKPRTITVRVVVSVTVDRDLYAMAYGTDGAGEIRDYVRHSIVDSAAPYGGTFADDSGVIAAEDRTA